MRVRFLLRRADRDIVLPELSITVGRSSACDVVLDDPRISAEHARLVAGASGVTVTDLGSRNGVFVNGARIKQQASLTAGASASKGSCGSDRGSAASRATTEAELDDGAGHSPTGRLRPWCGWPMAP
jgi:pSer/pThr/pTyr-binding forkhead associated (FHA) protein